jgi:hypothetical protein
VSTGGAVPKASGSALAGADQRHARALGQLVQVAQLAQGGGALPDVGGGRRGAVTRQGIAARAEHNVRLGRTGRECGGDLGPAHFVLGQEHQV